MKHTTMLAGLGLLSLCFGCQSNAHLTKSVEQQQQIINELQTKVAKMEAVMTQVQQDVQGLKQESSIVKEDIKKVQPGYVEGNLQEGGN